MELDNGNVMWLTDVAAAQGHQDPEGFAALIVANARDREDGNWGGITEDEARSQGIDGFSEPVLSVFAALQGQKAKTAGRDGVLSRYNAGIVAGTAAKNPFVDGQGRLTLHNVPEFNLEESTAKLADTIMDRLNEMDG